MQKSDFSNGGFVLHKVILPGRTGRFSAWFNAKCELVDAEQFVPNRTQPRDVVKNSETWDMLQGVGMRVGLIK